MTGEVAIVGLEAPSVGLEAGMKGESEVGARAGAIVCSLSGTEGLSDFAVTARAGADALGCTATGDAGVGEGEGGDAGALPETGW